MAKSTKKSPLHCPYCGGNLVVDLIDLHESCCDDCGRVFTAGLPHTYANSKKSENERLRETIKRLDKQIERLAEERDQARRELAELRVELAALVEAVEVERPYFQIGLGSARAVLAATGKDGR